MAIYAVRKGRNTGKFSTWEACQKQILGFSGAEFKKFNSEEEADAYLRGYNAPKKSNENAPKLRPAAIGKTKEQIAIEERKEEYTRICSTLADGEAIAYVDGSYIDSTRTFGYGCILYTKDGEQLFSGCSREKHFAEMQSASGECLGAIMALKEAVKNGCSKLTIYHDYKGIGLWGTGAWRAKCLVSILYVEYLRKVQQYMTVEFVWVKGHGDNIHNIRADHLASKAVRSDKVFDILKFFQDANINVPIQLSFDDV